MTIAVFLLIIALSIGLALAARRGHLDPDARAFFTASGQFGSWLVFFLSVGETYSVATMLAFPGGIYAHGDAFGMWFFGYILMVAPVMFFLGPWIARAGRHYSAATIADFFGRHFESRALERVIALAAIVMLVPVATMQFIGLRIVLETLAPGVSPLLLAGGMAALVLFYVAASGLRASAYVSVLKDLLMVGSILLVGGVALATWRHGLIPDAGITTKPLGAREMTTAVTTVLVNGVGYAMLPQTWGLLFSARSSGAIRRAQVAAPLYMLMFPLLMCVATYAVLHGLHPPKADFVFLTTAAALLPGWTIGLVLAGVTLAGLVVLTAVCLAIGSLVTRNLLWGLGNRAQTNGAKLVTALYLLLSILAAEGTGGLMATMNLLTYYGIVQALPGFVAAFFWPRVSAVAVIGGLLAGDCVGIGLFGTGVDLSGINPGLIGLGANLLVLLAWSTIAPRKGAAPLATILLPERSPA